MVARNSISVGDTVSFTLGITPIRGVVVEDRGPLGANRVHLFGVRIPNDPFDERIVELPEDSLTLAHADLEPISSASAEEYLVHGGLLQILKSNMERGRNQPHVWLTRDSLGNVVHTFFADRGLRGGAMIPCFVLKDNKIFAPKLNEVLAYLRTFGFSQAEAERIVKQVGTRS